MKNNFLPVIGHDFQFRTNPMPGIDFNGTCYCKVLKIIPYETLSYSWKCGPSEDEIKLDTVVEWQLVSTAEGTELYLEHSGFGKEENPDYYPMMTEGWAKNVHKITTLLKDIQHVTGKA